jgi:UDPglucose 6-dehydrogenase
MKISVIGLGKLGGSMAASFASCGFSVIGMDVNPAHVDAFNQGFSPVQETGLGDMISANRNLIRATLSTEEAVVESDITFVIIPTPSDERGAFSLKFAKEAFTAIGRALKKKSAYHVIVMTSTVLPGSMRFGLIPILESESGLKCGKDFGVCYNPEFIALGSVIRDFLNPDFYLLGEFDSRSGDCLEAIHHKVSQNKAPVKRMSLENAELAKISVNSFVTMKISFANMLAEFCESIPGADVDVVSDALGMDKRIGRKYLTGGLGFAGPCFPRDNVALSFLGKYLGCDSSLLEANDNFNRSLPTRQVRSLLHKIPPTGNIAILGMSYKPLSHVIEQSPGVALAKVFVESGYAVSVHDSLALNEVRSVLGSSVKYCDEVDCAVSGADVVLVTTTDEQYLKLDPNSLVCGQRNIFVVDFWRRLRHFSSIKGIVYIPVGSCTDEVTATRSLEFLWS